jgi:putative colanic acid biosynthesis acetyltransferase WcaF
MPKRLYVDEMPRKLKLRRLVWEITYTLLFKPTPRFAFGKWRLALLRAFGAKIGPGCRVAPNCFVWAPWNLTMGAYACLGDGVDCYSQAMITLGDYATVSQRAFLCTASHDIRKIKRPLVSQPITVEDHAWVCAEAFVGPGCTVGEGSIVGARSVLVSNVPDWRVFAGNPARDRGARCVKS